MPKRKNLTGKRFGMLTVTRDVRGGGPAESNGRNPYVEVQCDCGNTTTIHKQQLRRGQTDCGCIPKIPGGTTHGMSKTKINVWWQTNKARCVKRWRESFQAVIDDTGAGANDTLIRIDRRKLYGPNNYQIGNARGGAVLIEFADKHKTLVGWAKVLGVSKQRAFQLHEKGRLIQRLEAHQAGHITPSK